MSEDEKVMLRELNKNVKRLMVLVAIVICFMVVTRAVESVSNDIAIARVTETNAEMVEKMVRDYFTTDYAYPELQQTTDIDINGGTEE